MFRSSTSKIILLLFMLVFLFKAFYLDYIPLQYDGTLYGEMIAEEAEELTFLPRYLGMWAPWKPGLYFIVYSFFLPLTSALFNSIEWIYRSPNLLFSIVNAFLFYSIAKRFVKQEVALSASLLFYSSYGVIYTDSRLLMETFSLVPILLSILFYTRKEMEPTKRFLGAGIFACIAALTKSIISFMIIPLALAYIFREDQKNIKNPLFLVSLLSPFLGFLLFYLALDSVGLVEEVLILDTGKFFLFNYFEDSISNIFQGLLFFFYMFWMYIAVAFRKLASSWKKYPLFSIWIILSLIPLLSGHPMPWHFYYIAPALAFFAAVCLSSKGKMDSFSVLILAILVFSNLLVAGFYFNSVVSSGITEEAGGREAGMLLSGKQNVLVIGYYSPSTTIVSYKMLSERRDMGRPLDFGYVICVIPEGDKMKKTEQMIAINEIVRDYDTEKYLFEEDNFANMFQTKKFLRKNTSIKNFDYVVVSPSYFDLVDPCYISIYET
ncbi:MAG: ArnT family glycosyltransferase, partial [Candidatus Micrarchaeia archaeon]